MQAGCVNVCAMPAFARWTAVESRVLRPHEYILLCVVYACTCMAVLFVQDECSFLNRTVLGWLPIAALSLRQVVIALVALQAPCTG